MQIYHYHPSTLEYIGAGTADPSPLEPGVWLIPGNATTINPPVPVAGKVRHFVSGAWEYADVVAEPVDPEYEPSLLDVFNAKLAAINAGKNVVLDAGFTHDGVLYDSDLKARTAYLELDTELHINPTYTTPWKASRGVWVTMDKTLYDALRVSYKAHISACFAWQAAREMEVAAAGAIGDREAILAVSETM